MTQLSWLTSAFLVSLSIASALHAEQYPSRPLRFVVPGPAGGTTDILARAIGQKLSEALGQQVVIDNRPGASGIIGTEIVAKAQPDGYTMILVASSFVINPGIRKKLPYDTVRDLGPVTLVAMVPLVLVVNPALPVKAVKGLIAFARSKPGGINYGSGGSGTSSHLAAELFNVMADTQIVHVPYKGVATALPDLMAGRISVMYPNVPLVLPQINAGKLRALGVTTARRVATLPDVPTISEAGLPGYEVSPPYGILVPARTPKEIVERLNREILKALHTSEIKERMSAEGAVLIGTSPQEYTAYIKTEIAKWAKVTQRAAARVD